VNLEVLRRLRGLGVRVAIDDFGTGYSSLAYLGTFPVDEVKIDKSFVDGLDRDDTAQESLVAAITAMAGALGHTTVAEGVETVRQFERLARLGVDAAQGYLFARAVHAAEVASTLDRLRRQAAAAGSGPVARARTA
jgi:EAL domain-containing protein (putative c-di-GMP-specific phosphodiesterase class I)